MIEIRKATSADAIAMAKVVARGWAESYGGIIPDEILTHQSSASAIQRNADDMRAWLESGQSYWVIEQENIITGIAVAAPARDADSPVPTELIAIYLTNSEKGQGTSDRLIAAAIGDSPCMLWVLRDNARAIAFYHRHGFEFDGTEQPALRDNPEIVESRMARPPEHLHSPSIHCDQYAA